MPVDLNINQFALSALGAKITANGQLTGPEGGDLIQAPVGKLNATFEGVNGLLDTLGSMGLVPEDQLMSAEGFGILAKEFVDVYRKMGA